MDRNLVLASYKNHGNAATRFAHEEYERKERERREAEEKERGKTEQIAKERKRDEQRRDNGIVVQEEGDAVTKNTVPQPPARNISKKDSRNDSFPIPFPSGVSDKTDQERSVETSTPQKAWTNIKLPLLPGNVCIPNNAWRDLIYLGKCGKLSNVFYMPESGDDEKHKHGVLFIEMPEFEVLRKLQWTAYMKLEGEEIESFHSAWKTTFDKFKEIDREAKTAQIPPVHETLCQDFTVVSLQYFSQGGNYKDFNEAVPETYYMSGDVANGTRQSGKALFGMKVRRHTGQITGQQWWWKEPPFEMLFGLFLDEREIETILTFTDRGYLEQAMQAARRGRQ